MKPGISDLSHNLDLLWTGIKTKQILATPLARLFRVCPLEGAKNKLEFKIKIQNKLRPFNVAFGWFCGLPLTVQKHKYKDE